MLLCGDVDDRSPAAWVYPLMTPILLSRKNWSNCCSACTSFAYGDTFNWKNPDSHSDFAITVYTAFEYQMGGVGFDHKTCLLLVAMKWYEVLRFCNKMSVYTLFSQKTTLIAGIGRWIATSFGLSPAVLWTSELAVVLRVGAVLLSG